LHYQSGSLETLMRLVDHQGGITIIPDMARNQLSKAQKAGNTSAIASDLAQRQIVIVFKHTLQKKRLLEALRIGTLSYLQSHA
jgi:LysR family hydrogen peroxide-inducible transcriptional activator